MVAWHSDHRWDLVSPPPACLPACLLAWLMVYNVCCGFRAAAVVVGTHSTKHNSD